MDKKNIILYNSWLLIFGQTGLCPKIESQYKDLAKSENFRLRSGCPNRVGRPESILSHCIKQVFQRIIVC